MSLRLLRLGWMKKSNTKPHTNVQGLGKPETVNDGSEIKEGSR